MVSEYNEKMYEKPTKDSNGNFDFALVDLKLARNYTQGSEIIPVRNITPVGQSAQEVKITDGTDNLAINSDGSINISGGSNALSVAYSSTAANNNTQTIYTVPAGKKAKVFSYGISCKGAADVQGYMTIGGVGAMGVLMSSLCSQSVNLGNNYILLTAGQSVTVTSPSSTHYTTGHIAYIEETA